MSSDFELADSPAQGAVIKVIGVGGGGGNAVEHMLEQSIEGVDFICANTDAQALKNSHAKTTLQLGDDITKGLGAGANPEIGQKAAEADIDRIRSVLKGSDIVFITAGMGGGTGTGAAPIFAQAAKNLGILTVAVVTKPFTFEGKKRLQVAEEGIKQLEEHVDSLITIPNNKLMNVLGKHVSLLDAFKAVNNVLLGAVKGIAELITQPGLINVDFADVRAVMSEMGLAMIGTGVASGEDRARVAAENAIASPLIDRSDIANALAILVNITTGPNFSIGEFEEIGEVIKNFASEGATIVVGTVIDPKMTDELHITIVLTGLGKHQDGGTGGSGVARKRARMDETTTRFVREANYHHLERPTVLRKKSAATRPVTENDATATDVEYLDIPAFLRRQEEVEEV